MIKLSTLKPWPKNPRKISKEQLEKLKQSISENPEFMIARPIIVNPEMVVIGGNQRLKACLGLGMKEVPEEWVKQVSWEESKQKRFNVVDNAVPGMSGEWDFELLAEEWGEDELDDWGFDKDECAVDFIPEDNKDIDEDAMAETKNECPKCGFKW